MWKLLKLCWLAIFFFQAKKVMNTKRIRNYLQDLASKEFVFNSEKKIKNQQNIQNPALLLLNMLLTIVSHTQQKQQLN